MAMRATRMPANHPATPNDSAAPRPPWPYVALLWLCVWSRNHTLLHIAKTGGTSLEAYDLSAPVRLFRYHRKVPPRGGFFVPNTCRIIDRMVSLWHWTSRQLAACGMRDELNPYLQRGTQRYCVVRDPVDRFASSFLWARSSNGITKVFWPARCGKPEHNESQVVAQLHCYLGVINASIFRGARSQPAALQRVGQTVDSPVFMVV